MQTATATTAPDGVATLSDRFETLPIDTIERSATNPRTHFDDAYIAELATSISERGLIQPIVVRPLKRGGYEIVAGECRWRAAKLAGLIRIPAIVRAMTDAQVLEAQLEENIHRKDLTPLEEASGYRRLIDSNPTKHSAASIATRIGMSPTYVWDRLKLNDLVPDAKQLLEEERISVGHGIVISRLKPKDQERVIAVNKRGYGGIDSGLWEGEDAKLGFDEATGKPLKGTSKFDGYKPKTVRELEAWIRDRIRFDVEHAAAAAPLEFEPVKTAVDEAAAQPGRGKKVVAITFDAVAHTPAAKSDDERTYGSSAWKRADGQHGSKTCEHAVLGVVVAGEREYGRSFLVCVARQKCEVHWGKEIRERQKAEKLRASGQTKKAAAVEKRQRDSYEEQERRWREARKAWDALLAKAMPALAEHLKGAKLTTDLVVSLMSDWHRKQIEKLTGPITDKNIGQAVALCVVIEGGTHDRAAFLRSVKPFKFNLGVVEQAEKAAPAPKADKPAKAAKAGKKR